MPIPHWMFSAHSDGMANLSADIGEISWQDARPAGALGSLVLVIDALQRARTSPVSRARLRTICLLRSFSTVFAQAEALAASARSLRAMLSFSTVGNQSVTSWPPEPPVCCGASRLHLAIRFQQPAAPSEGWWWVLPASLRLRSGAPRSLDRACQRGPNCRTTPDRYIIDTHSNM